MLQPRKAVLLVVLLLGQACIQADGLEGLTEPDQPGILASTAYTTVTLIQQDFEGTPLGAEPYPFIAETWCPNSFVGASTDVSQSGTTSFKYFHGCAPGVAATGTSLSFAMCTRWPTRAQVVFSRLHPAYGPSTFGIHSGLKHEPASGVLFGADGWIRVTDNVGSPIIVGSYVPGVWTKVATDWDFVAGTFELSLNDINIGTFPTSVRKAFWLSVFGHEPTTFYDDDFNVTLDLRGERQNCDGTEPLPWTWPPPEGQQGG